MGLLWRFALDALSPSNFFLTNPQALAKAVDTLGQSVLAGVTRVLSDMQRNALPASSETQAFAVGGNLATTVGAEVFQNEIFQLIQYQPLASKVRVVPILIVPPCVNKFYAFDLNEQKSFVKYLLEQGHNVFIMSWRNPRSGASGQGWDDYVYGGVHKTVEVACEIAGAPRLNLLAWCPCRRRCRAPMLNDRSAPSRLDYLRVFAPTRSCDASWTSGCAPMKSAA